MNEIYKKLESFGTVEYEVSFKDMTTFRVGGIVDVVIYPKDMIALEQILSLVKENMIPHKILGKGSNLLCSEQCFHGVIIRLDRTFNDYYFNETVCIAEAGCSIISISYAAAKSGLAGLEFASGIPGTVGGAVFMNAGAYKSSIKDILLEVLVYRDNDFSWVKAEELELNYRSSIFKNNPDWVIMAAKFQLHEADSNEIRSLMDDRQKRRLSTQPLNYPSAGSVFRNPVETSAWELITNAGFRGYQIGNAMISEKHCNFIINLGEATADDIWKIICHAKEEVLKQHEIELILEIERFNWDE